MLALRHGGARYVDFSLEVPGLYFYSLGADADAPAAAGARRLAASEFYPSMNAHGGGTFKWRGPSNEVQRQHLSESNPLPSYRRKYHQPAAAGASSDASSDALFDLARDIAERQLHATREDVDFISAPLLKSFMIYNGCHHEMADILSNNLSDTVGGFTRHVSVVPPLPPRPHRTESYRRDRIGPIFIVGLNFIVGPHQTDKSRRFLSIIVGTAPDRILSSGQHRTESYRRTEFIVGTASWPLHVLATRVVAMVALAAAP